MTSRRSTIGKCRSRNRKKFPVITRRMKHESQDSERVVVVCLARRFYRINLIVTSAASACDELTNAKLLVQLSVRIERRKPLIVMIVTRKHKIGAMLIESPPERIDLVLIPVFPGRETGVVPIR